MSGCRHHTFTCASLWVHNNAISTIKRRQLRDNARQWQAAITLQLQCDTVMDRVRGHQMTWHADQSAALQYPIIHRKS